MNDEQNTQQNITTEMHTPNTTTVTHDTKRTIALGVLIILLIVILGGLYLWGSLLVKQQGTDVTPTQTETVSIPSADLDILRLNTMSSSDELGAIDADLESTDLESLDADIDLLEREVSNKQ
jgi:flagellar basal body-associated protein FliL